MTAHPPLPSYEQIAIAGAVRCVGGANRLLLEATFRFDEGGYICEALNDISAATAELVADLHGRPVPIGPDVRRLWNPCDPSSGMIPDWMTRVAVDWRRARR
jgi:hypothetical protein